MSRIAIAQNGKFILFRKKFQRPKGGSKNMFVVSLLLPYYYTQDERAEVLNTLVSFKGRGWGDSAAVFRKRVDAEKAWVLATLKWS